MDAFVRLLAFLEAHPEVLTEVLKLANALVEKHPDAAIGLLQRLVPPPK
jgi:hypothetical protein